MDYDWNAIGTGLAAIGAMALGAFGLLKGAVKGNAKPPVERAPSPHETREEMAGLRVEIRTGLQLITDGIHRIERSNGTLAEDHRELRRLLAELNTEVRKLDE